MDDDEFNTVMYHASSCLSLLKNLHGKLEARHLNILCDLLRLLNSCISRICADADPGEDENSSKNTRVERVRNMIKQSLDAVCTWLTKALRVRIPADGKSARDEFRVGGAQ